jgi:hypothetical protein
LLVASGWKRSPVAHDGSQRRGQGAIFRAQSSATLVLGASRFRTAPRRWTRAARQRAGADTAARRWSHARKGSGAGGQPSVNGEATIGSRATSATRSPTGSGTNRCPDASTSAISACRGRHAAATSARFVVRAGAAAGSTVRSSTAGPIGPGGAIATRNRAPVGVQLDRPVYLFPTRDRSRSWTCAIWRATDVRDAPTRIARGMASDSDRKDARTGRQRRGQRPLHGVSARCRIARWGDGRRIGDRGL